ncbi:MgtC/SapB family protein [Methyloceanibacter sp.]|uniref:MgtC/SapB family protein n=1 Tax=Methyloceanibacter sp. TaxID=1965321 RepID=UPI002D2A6209|nr:MgtC/SapB family protein [Methyloceanibacter sp.]HZP08180.1 MgtC/SapB family protein [Methyloceanibacter sp.]
MEQEDLIAVAGDFAVAILLGALVGIEREKRKMEESDTEHIAGLRTFTLLGLVGAASGYLAKNLSSPWILAAALVVVGAFVVVGYLSTARVSQDGKGLTTEVAALVVFLLGALVMFGHRELAIGLGVITAAVLAYKQPLHGFVEKLGWDDVFAGLRLLIATFIALPLLPDKPIDPWGALNPYKLWLLVILISSLSLVGYVLTRWLGPARGTALTGLTGGLVSSTAVTLSFAKEARDKPENSAALACGILLSWAVMFLRVIVLVAVVNRTLLAQVLVPFAVMAVAVGAYAAFLYFRDGSVDGERLKGKVEVKNPFSLVEAAKFGALFAVVLVAVKIVQEHFPPSGLYAVAGLAGLTDVDAITLSMSEFAQSGEARVAVIAIVIASLSNTIVKCGMAFVLGGQELGKKLLIATALTLAAGLAAALLV